jgi:hypothetical protein
MREDQVVRNVLCCALFCLVASTNFGQITTGGATSGYSRITPTDLAGHNPGTSYAVTLSGQNAGSLSWTDTFGTALEMGPDGTIGTAENPYRGRSWIGLTGSFIYNLSNLNLSAFPSVAAVGLEFDTHALIDHDAVSLVLRDGTNVLNTISSADYTGFGPWSFVIPAADFQSSSRNLSVDLSLSGGDGQWFSEGVQVLVPEPSGFVLGCFGLFALLVVFRKRSSNRLNT